MSQGVFFKIVIPNYNNEKFIGKCLDSILSQTEKSFIVVVVDDLSTDNSKKVVRERQQKFPDKIVLLDSPRKGYTGLARDVGIDYMETKSKYTFFMDADDWLFDKDSLKTLKNFAEKFDYDMITFPWCEYENNKLSTPIKYKHIDVNDAKSINSVGVAPWHRIVKTPLVARFLTDMTRHEDTAQFLLQLDKVKTIGECPSTIYVYNIRHGSWRANKIKEPYNPAKEYEYLNWHVIKWHYYMDRLLSEIKNPEIKKVVTVKRDKFKDDFEKYVVLDDDVYIAMASFPKRKAAMLNVVDKLHKQCKKMFIWLNEYDKIPEELSKYDNVICELAGPGRNLKENGKFFWVGKVPGYYVTVDDDLNYPNDYIEKIVAGLKKYKDAVFVGYHGATFDIKDGKVVNRDKLYMYSAKQDVDIRVNRLGSGCMACKPHIVGLNTANVNELKQWDGDATPALIAAKLRVPMILLAKPENWITPMIISKTDYTNVNALCADKNTIKKRKKIYDLFDKWEDVRKKAELKICVISAATENLKYQYEYTNKNKETYCKSHGYDYKFELIKETEKKAYHYRKDMILRYLDKYDYVVWMDVDAWFNNKTISFENIIHEIGENYDLIVSYDHPNVNSPKDWHDKYINSGVLIFKNTENSRKMIKLWANPPVDAKKWMSSHTGLNDQPYLSMYILWDSFFQNKVKVVPPRVLNWFLASGSIGDQFIVHAAGMKYSKNIQTAFNNIFNIPQRKPVSSKSKIIEALNSDIFIPNGFELKPTLHKASDYNKPFGLIDWN